MVNASLGAMVSTLAFSPPTWMVGILVMLFVVVSVLLILTILIQRPQGGGLSGAFGSGAGSGQTAFGAKTGDALTIATIGMFGLWIVFAVVLNFTVRPLEAIAAPPAVTAPAEGGAAPADKNAPASDKPAEKTPADGKPADEKPAGEPEQPAVEKPVSPPPATPPSPPADSPEKKDPGSPNLPPR